MTQQQLLRFVLFPPLLSDPAYAKRIQRDSPELPLINASAAVSIFCHWVRKGNRVVAMEGGVCLALLFPGLSKKLRARVVNELLPLLVAGNRTSQREASAYALQYSSSRRVVRELATVAGSRRASPRLREIAQGAARSLGRKDDR